MNELPNHGTGFHRVEYETKEDGSVDILKVEFERKDKEKHFYGFGLEQKDKQ